MGSNNFALVIQPPTTTTNPSGALIANYTSLSGGTSDIPNPTIVGGAPVSTVLELQSTTGAFLLPRMTSTQRDALVTITNGMMIYNTTTSLIQGYEGGSWSGTGPGTVTSVSGTLNRITVTNPTTTPVIDISAAYVGQASITTVGALASGSLAAGFTPVTVPLGGTGNTTFTAYSLIAAGTTATGAFQNVVGVGTSGQLLTSNGASALPSWQAAPAGGVTSVSGTSNRITSTGGATPVIDISAAYVGQTSITTVGALSTGSLTTGFTAVNVAQGGTGVATTTAYGVLTGGTTATGAFQNAGAGLAGQALLSGGAAALPAYSTATYPLTTTINQLLYSSSASVITGLTTANKAVLTTGATGIPVLTAIATDGQIIIGSTAGVPAAATLTQGTGITITNAGNSITIAATATGVTIVNQNSGSVTMAANSEYYINNGASLVTLTLPASAAVGDTYTIVGQSSGGWIVAEASGQTIHSNGNATTTTTGTLASTNQYNSLVLKCIVANTTFSAVNINGSLTIV